MKAQELIDGAVDATGLSDFGDDELFGGDGWRAALDVLVASFDDEARLNDIGQVMVPGELTGYLVNRLGLVAHHRAHPDLRERPITAPLVIIGQARTGTTMLFDMLAQDPAHRVPQTWEVDQPLPPPRTETYLTDPRIAVSDATFELVDSVIPEFRAVHQLGAQLAQECVRITGSCFTSAIFPTQYRVPSYLDWLLHDAVDDGHIAASYTWHRRFLEVLQSEAPGHRWLLKTPFHSWTLPQLVAEYPDALLVQTHRDPAKVMASTTSLLATLRQLGSSEIEYQELATEFYEIILGGLERTVDARLDGTIAPDQVVDLQFDHVMAEPLAGARAVYDGFGWDFTPDLGARMSEFLRTHEREGHGHPYTFESTGLDLDRVRTDTARYVAHFGVPIEQR
ncbi:sulfotransferase family protein [Nocardioides mangrovi]|uniref:Sulfotransferase n=1 Tax=Nocardioides mangrovi TaxID=2874580 RepID=A0ABS7UE30_9ACTN|nr:sulfotransferase [Nocardioides mangrovi]MBZ5739037.1 sulfotransferase [Nocardioides mangrovi]